MNKVLVVAPHPDDEILGCGGTIKKYINDGAEVNIIIVTRGAKDMYDAAKVEETRQEARNSHSYLGVKGTYFLEFEAPKLDITPSYLIANEINKYLNELKPDTLFLPHRGDIHKDHGAVFDAALVAARPINNCSVKNIYCYETLSETEWSPPFSSDLFLPTLFIDITETLSNKIEAMRFFKSQLKQFPSTRSVEVIQALAMYRGATVGAFAAESFNVIREIR